MRHILYGFAFLVLCGSAAAQVPIRGIGNALFQGKTPPPGAVTVVGRSFANSVQNGLGTSVALIIGSDDPKVREELGLTDDEVNKLRLLKTQIALQAPKYVTKFKSLKTEEEAGLQAEIEKDFGKITDHLNETFTAERKAKAQKLMFQSLGGLNSPMVNPDMLDALNVNADQKTKAKAIFDEMKPERLALLEDGLKLAEKAIALGGPNMSAEDREQLRAEREALAARAFTLSKKLGDRLRETLTPEQLGMEKNLIASRPSFLPPLPRQMRELESEQYVPGVNSWQPGQGVPIKTEERKLKQFPTKE
jgi:Spy/CpxP family protein refolding chaperone